MAKKKSQNLSALLKKYTIINDTNPKQYGLGSWLGENAVPLLQTGAGAALTATGVGAPLGVGLMAQGATGLAANNLATNQQEAQNIQGIGSLAGQVGGAAASGQLAKPQELEQGGQLTEYNGNTHEQGGIAIGQNAEVEDKETRWEDYIFSEKVKIPGKDVSFSDASKKINKKYTQRENDPYDKKALEREMKALMAMQEGERERMGIKHREVMKAAFGGNISGDGDGDGTTPIATEVDAPIEYTKEMFDNIVTPEDATNFLTAQEDAKGKDISNDPNSQLKLLDTSNKEGFYNALREYTGINYQNKQVDGISSWSLVPDEVRIPSDPSHTTPYNPGLRLNPETNALEQYRQGKVTGEPNWQAANANMAQKYISTQNLDPRDRKEILYDLNNNKENYINSLNKPSLDTYEEKKYGGKLKYNGGGNFGLDLSQLNAAQNAANTMNPDTSAFDVNAQQNHQFNTLNDSTIKYPSLKDTYTTGLPDQSGSTINNKGALVPGDGSGYTNAPQGQGFDWKKAGIFAAQNIGNASNIIQGLRGAEEVKPNLVNPKSVDYSAALKSTTDSYNTAANIARESIRRNATSSGQALSNTIAQNTSLTKDKTNALANIQEQQSNQNVGIQNQAESQNANILGQTQNLQAENDAAASNALNQGLTGVGTSVAMGNRDALAGKAQDRAMYQYMKQNGYEWRPGEDGNPVMYSIATNKPV